MRSLILATAGIWAGHLRDGDPVLMRRLEAGTVLSHPLVIGELAMGRLRHRQTVLDALRALPTAIVASDDEVFEFIERGAFGFCKENVKALMESTKDINAGHAVKA